MVGKWIQECGAWILSISLSEDLLCVPKENEKNSFALITAFPSDYGYGILSAKTRQK